VDEGSPWLFILLVILIFLSGFFSASETALTSLSKIRLRNMVDEKVKNADKISKLIGDPNRLLSSILVGNNLVNIGASSLATVLAINTFGSSGVGFATGLMTLAILIFGEITPKTLAAQNAERVSLLVVNSVYCVVIVLTPVVKVLSFVTDGFIRLLGGNPNGGIPIITEAELKTMVNVSHEAGVLENDERTMINNVFDFGDAKAKDIMIPRMDMTSIGDDITYNEVVTLFKEERFSRLPVYHESIDNIVGILYVKDIIFINEATFRTEDYMREPFFTYESKPVSGLFSQMRKNRIPLAVILDEYGGTAGIITIEDMVEEIVGEIDDEYDEPEEEIIIIQEGEFIVDGSTRLDDLNEIIGTHLESEDFDTIGGYVIEILGNLPEDGEILENDGIRIVVEKMEKNRIERLHIFTKWS